MKGKLLDEFSGNNEVTLVTGGKDYFNKLLQLIFNADKSLHLQTYIFADDETGHLVKNALTTAAQRGVAVFLMVDGYASQSLSKAFINELRQSGVKFKFFEPLFRSRRFYLGRRLHHKICVADQRFALVGGINVADHYNDMPGNPPWLDFALLVEGELVNELTILCQKTWNGFLPMKKVPEIKGVPEFSFPVKSKRLIRMRRNDWVRRKSQISQSYFQMFREAESHILILSSYFLPGKLFRKAIREARSRGVEITVIVAGISDVKMAKMAERYMYEWLLTNGIRIMEYNQTVLHGKLAICDDQWFTLGSYNVNDISTYVSVELNLDVYDENFTKELLQHLDQNVLSHSTLISPTYMASHTSWFNRMLQWSAFASIRVLFYFFTFYFKRIAKQNEGIKKSEL